MESDHVLWLVLVPVSQGYFGQSGIHVFFLHNFCWNSKDIAFLNHTVVQIVDRKIQCISLEEP